ncbi:hypothetical protein [Streptomyces lydicus]|uniref:hypothetical protein n=1 Tax=Streptomyces lydicus TaxID=47763 RepID=UPI0036E5E96F
MHLYPAVREHLENGDLLADSGIADHQRVERLLTELEGRARLRHRPRPAPGTSRGALTGPGPGPRRPGPVSRPRLRAVPRPGGGGRCCGRCSRRW